MEPSYCAEKNENEQETAGSRKLCPQKRKPMREEQVGRLRGFLGRTMSPVSISSSYVSKTRHPEWLRDPNTVVGTLLKSMSRRPV